jgi:hypothetical protein
VAPIPASFQQSAESHLTLDDLTAIYHQNEKGESEAGAILLIAAWSVACVCAGNGESAAIAA